jgi:uncharacterized membrane protein
MSGEFDPRSPQRGVGSSASPAADSSVLPGSREQLVPAVEFAPHAGLFRTWLQRTSGKNGQARLELLALALLLLTAIIVEVAIAGWLQVQAYLAFNTSAQDLGTFNQAFATTVSFGHFFYYTTDLPTGNNGQLFASHFSPTLLLLVPFYALAPGPETLLVMKQAVIAIAAFPLFAFARRRLNSAGLAILISVLYVFNPVVMSIDWSNFDPEVLLPLTVISTVYLYDTRRYSAFLLTWIAALGVIEASAPLLIVLAVAAILSSLAPSILTSPERSQVGRRWLVIASLVAVGWLVLSLAVLSSLSPLGGAFGDAYARHFTVLGANSVPQVFSVALLHPGRALAAAQYAGQTKVVYLLVVFGAVGFFPLIGRLRYLLPMLLWIGLALLSNGSSFYMLGAEYAAFVVPFGFLGLVTGIEALGAKEFWWDRVSKVGSRLWSRLSRVPQSKQAPTTSITRPMKVSANRAHELDMTAASGRRSSFGWDRTDNRGLVASIVAILFISFVIAEATTSPLLLHPADEVPWNTYALPTVSEHDQLVHRLVDLIPPTASVLTTTQLFPEVSGRLNAFVVPGEGLMAGNRTVPGVINGYLERVNWVLLDYRLDWAPAVETQFLGNLSDFGVYATADGAYLLERGWTGAPVLFVPEVQYFSPSDLTLGDSTLDYSSSTQYGPSIHHSAQRGNGTVWKGPGFFWLGPGRYTATIWWAVTWPAGPATPRVEVQFRHNIEIVTTTPFAPTTAGVHYSVQAVTTGAFVPIANASLTPAAHLAGAFSGNTTVGFSWDGIGTLSFPGTVLAEQVSVYLYAVSIEQTSATTPA